MRKIAALALLFLLTATSALQAQLFSPGKLAAAHESLEGLRNCTSCHELRQRGTSNALCLDCHKTIATRIAAGTGLHSTYGTRNCASCHRDHLGLDHKLIALDTTRFDHDTTRFTLGGSHLDTGCRKCHTPARIIAADVRGFEGEHGALARTFLGLPVTCVGCHQGDSPHGTQFGQRSCDACHTDVDWKKADQFDHARARFQLTGQHLTLECSKCHADRSRDPAKPKVQYTGIPSGTCNACHTDPHNGTMAGACTFCHNTTGWHNVVGAGLDGKFDHSRTHFPLVAAHTTVACATCHDTRAAKPAKIRITWAPGSEGATFGKPVYAGCTGCHVDEHAGVIAASPGGGACTTCHTNDAWTPTTYDVARHNAGIPRFALIGAHATVACAACHDARAVARPDPGTTGIRITWAPGSDGASFGKPVFASCLGCHVDKHAGTFASSPGGSSCTNCHGNAAWIPTTYDLARHNASTSRFALTGAHMAVPCTACHAGADSTHLTVFRIASTTCIACHATKDPHQGQFAGRTCESCHLTTTFALASFDHSKTRYPLDGAHRAVPCTSCHRTETAPNGRTFRRFTPLGTTCRDCHGGTR